MSKKRKQHRRKPLSANELERRRKLHDERIKRKKKEKWIFLIKIAVIVVSIIVLFTIGIVIDVLRGNHAMIVYISVVTVIITTITDRSGLRTILFSFYPDKFLFSEYLKKSYPQRSFLMELSRTICYYALCLIIICEKLSALWAVLCIVAMIIGYVYIIFDRNDRYTFDKNSKFSDTSMFLIFAGLVGMGSVDQISIPLSVVVCGAFFFTVLYLIFGKNKRKIELAFEVAIFSSMDILTAIALIKLFL